MKRGSEKSGRFSSKQQRALLSFVEIIESDKTGARERRSRRTRSKCSPGRECLRKELQPPLLGAWGSLDALPDLLASRRDPLTASKTLLLWFVKDAM